MRRWSCDPRRSDPRVGGDRRQRIIAARRLHFAEPPLGAGGDAGDDFGGFNAPDGLDGIGESIAPEDAGLPCADPADLKGGDAQVNAAAIHDALERFVKLYPKQLPADAEALGERLVA